MIRLLFLKINFNSIFSLIIWKYYPETAGKSLEDTESLFDSAVGGSDTRSISLSTLPGIELKRTSMSVELGTSRASISTDVKAQHSQPRNSLSLDMRQDSQTESSSRNTSPADSTDTIVDTSIVKS